MEPREVLAACVNIECDAFEEDIVVFEADLYICGPCGEEIPSIREIKETE